jgi:hypothetical protein
MKTDTNKDSTTPDVETIIANIRNDISAAEPKEEPAEDNTDIHEHLEILCNTYSGGHLPSGGIVAAIRKAFYRMLGINNVNGRIVSILARLIAIIEGAETPESGVILGKQRRTSDIMSKISGRIDQYDDMSINDRLTKIEEQIEKINASEKS